MAVGPRYLTGPDYLSGIAVVAGRPQRCIHAKEGVILCEKSRAAKRGGFKRGGLPDLDLSFLFCPSPSFLGLSRFFFGIFPICPGTLFGDFPDCPFPLSRPINSAYEEQSRKGLRRLCDTIWDLSRKSGKPPGLETTRFSFSQKRRDSAF